MVRCQAKGFSVIFQRGDHLFICYYIISRVNIKGPYFLCYTCFKPKIWSWMCTFLIKLKYRKNNMCGYRGLFVILNFLLLFSCFENWTEGLYFCGLFNCTVLQCMQWWCSVVLQCIHWWCSGDRIDFPIKSKLPFL